MLFATDKKESTRSAWYRRVINWWPCIWCTGGKVDFLASDFQEMHISLGLGIRTRNRVGTVFGGSIYSAVDPYFMLMFMQILGPSYIVWDKGANIKFIKPITSRVKCRFLIEQSQVDNIIHDISQNGQSVFELHLQWVDESGTVYATIAKTIYAASKEYYHAKLKAKNTA